MYIEYQLHIGYIFFLLIKKTPQLICLALFLEPSVGRGNVLWSLSPEPWALHLLLGIRMQSLTAPYPDISQSCICSEVTMKNEEMSPSSPQSTLVYF